MTTIKKESFTSKCRRLGVTYGQYKYYERLHPDLTTEQIDEYFRQRLLNGKDSFKARCERAGVNYDTACQYRARHSEISQEDTIRYFVSKRNNKLLEQQALQRCKELKIPMKMFNNTRTDNPTLTYDEVIKLCLETLSKRPKTFKYKCEKAGVNYPNARHYKVYHPDLTDEQIIEYYLHRGE